MLYTFCQLLCLSFKPAIEISNDNIDGAILFGVNRCVASTLRMHGNVNAVTMLIFVSGELRRTGSTLMRTAADWPRGLWGSGSCSFGATGDYRYTVMAAACGVLYACQVRLPMTVNVQCHIDDSLQQWRTHFCRIINMCNNCLLQFACTCV